MGTRAERIMLKAIYPYHSNAEVAQMMSMPVGTIAARAFRHGIKKDKDYLSAVNKVNGSKGVLLHGRPQAKRRET